MMMMMLIIILTALKQLQIMNNPGMCGHYTVAILPQVMCSHSKSFQEISIGGFFAGKEKESIIEAE